MKNLQNLGLCLLITLITYQGFRIHFLADDVETLDKEFDWAFKHSIALDKRLDTLETKTQFTYQCLENLSINMERVQSKLGMHWDNGNTDSITRQLLTDSIIWDNHSRIDTGYTKGDNTVGKLGEGITKGGSPNFYIKDSLGQDPGVDVNSGKYKSLHKQKHVPISIRQKSVNGTRTYMSGDIQAEDTMYYTGRNKYQIQLAPFDWTQEDPYSKKWLGSKDTTQSFVTCLMTLKHYNELNHPFFPVVNYGDSNCSAFWFYVRYQMAWGEHHGGEILSRIVDRIPNDSIKAWMGSHIYDSIWKAESEQH